MEPQGQITSEFSDVIPEIWKINSDEPYSIRRWNPNSSEDSQRFTDIDRHPRVLTGMDNPDSSIGEDIDFLMRVGESDSKDPRAMFAVVDDRTGKALGFVQYYQDSNHPLPKDIKERLNLTADALILQVSYAKLFGKWPENSKFVKKRNNLEKEEHLEVGVSGVRQTLQHLREMEDIISKKGKAQPRKIIIYAYTDPDNIASEKVLAKNEFNKSDTQYEYDGVPNNMWWKEA